MGAEQTVNLYSLGFACEEVQYPAESCAHTQVDKAGPQRIKVVGKDRS